MLRDNAPAIINDVTVRTLKGIKLNHPTIALENDLNALGGSALNASGGSTVSHDAWYVIGDSDASGNMKQFLKYDIVRRFWSELPSLPWSRTNCGAWAVGNRLIVLGGNKGGPSTADIDEYDISSGSWSSSVARMSMARVRLAVCSDNNQQCAYAFGGYPKEAAKMAERYKCVTTNMKLSDVSEPTRHDSTVCFLTPNAVFVAGGASGKTYITTVDKYDTSANKWTHVGDMMFARSAFASTFVGDDMYLVGGRDKGLVFDVVEIFNTRTGQLRTAEKLLKPRHGFSATTISRGDVVCVMGGWGNGGRLRSVDTYDVREGKWSTGVIVPHMPAGAAYFGFAAV